MALLHLEKAILFASQGRDEDLLAEIGQGLEFSRQVPPARRSDSGRRIHSSLLLRLADFRTGRGEPAKARAALEEARQLETKVVGTTLARPRPGGPRAADLAAARDYFAAGLAAAAIRSDQCQLEADLGRTLYDPDFPSLDRGEEAHGGRRAAGSPAPKNWWRPTPATCAPFSRCSTPSARAARFCRRRAGAQPGQPGARRRGPRDPGNAGAAGGRPRAREGAGGGRPGLPLLRLGRAAEAERQLRAAGPMLAAHLADRQDSRAADAAWLAAIRRGELAEHAGQPATEDYLRALDLARQGELERPERPLQRHLGDRGRSSAGAAGRRKAGLSSRAPAPRPGQRFVVVGAAAAVFVAGLDLGRDFERLVVVGAGRAVFCRQP